jgi:predicted DNA-binding protein YlxM (UPF0122 family)
MVDFNKIKKCEETIKRNKEKLNIEKDFNKREKIKLKIKIEELKIKIERIN